MKTLPLVKAFASLNPYRTKGQTGRDETNICLNIKYSIAYACLLENINTHSLQINCLYFENIF